MSALKKKKPPDKAKSKKKISVNNTKSLCAKDTEYELVINDKVYHSIIKAVTYFLSKYNRTHVQSLIDKRANNSIAREDTRVICKGLDKKISIYSINNH